MTLHHPRPPTYILRTTVYHQQAHSLPCFRITKVRSSDRGNACHSDIRVTRSSSSKDADSDEISVDGTIKLCEDLEVDPEDIVMLAVAYELKSPRMGTWTKQGWIEGWRNLRYAPIHEMMWYQSHLSNTVRLPRCDNLNSMKQILPRLRDQLGSDPDYFKKVYNHTFDFARSEGQRSLGEFN